MECKLCGSDATLCNSHVIPEFVYNDLYDDKHTFHVISTLSKPIRKFEQKGIREKLLCSLCEGQISKYEDYAKRVIQGGVSLTVTRNSDVLKVEDIDYVKFKLFLLSLIFRAGIASHPLFARVKLGRHEQILKGMLASENAGLASDYPCLIFGLSGKKEVTGNLIDQPTKLRVSGVICYRFIFARFLWVFFVSSHAPNRIIMKHVLSQAGRIIIWIRPFTELGHFQQFAVDLKNKGVI